MRSGLAYAAIGVVLSGPAAAFASDKADVVAVVQAYNDAGNKSDRSGYASYCAEDAVVVDHVPPYVFQGPTACADEYDAVVAWSALNKISVDDYYQKVFEPVFFEVHGDMAYAVFPVKGWFKQNGSPQVEALYLTTTLRRQAHTWRITHLVYSTLGWAPGDKPG
jgi:ketosteroid isomerase-like protein